MTLNELLSVISVSNNITVYKTNMSYPVGSNSNIYVDSTTKNKEIFEDYLNNEVEMVTTIPEEILIFIK